MWSRLMTHDLPEKGLGIVDEGSCDLSSEGRRLTPIDSWCFTVGDASGEAYV
eukprot:gene20696-biopygen6888